MKNTDYFIGLDLGTESVGWAVTDIEYNVVKKNGKALWGVRLFDEAKTAEPTRLFRTARRRNARRKQRIAWLQQLFNDEISKIDVAFFQKLKESAFLQEDKAISCQFTLFSGDTFGDKEYHEKYPTIHHLRKALLSEDKQFDARLVYLALHHTLKNRGHFLIDSDISSEDSNFSNVLNSLQSYLGDEYETEITISDEAKFEDVLKDRTLGITKKKKALLELMDGTVCEQTKAIISMFAGATTKLAQICDDDTLNDEELSSLSLKSDDFDSKEVELESILGERIELIHCIKSVYDWAVLADILKGEKYISFAKVGVYEKHKSDLALLKRVLKRHIPNNDVYSKMFHNSTLKLNNYVAYSGKDSIKRCSYDDFSKYLKSVLKNIKSTDSDLEYINTGLEHGTFLPKQITSENSIIPQQVHKQELCEILKRAEGYLSFLREKDNSGLSVSEKIIKVFEFRVPYYVGPLNPAHGTQSKYAWTDKPKQAVYPWNFDKVINYFDSAEKFITRMTAKCTYIGKDVLPKNSLLYSEYMVLNELNNLSINGHRISTELKHKIYIDLFGKIKQVKQSKLKKYLISVGAISDDDIISGIDGDFKASLQSKQAFAQILAKSGNTVMVEDIIHHIVLFSNDSKMIRKWLDKTYGSVLSQDDISYVSKLKYSGWGRLSREFLTQIFHTDKNTGEAVSIIEMLHCSNSNLMELLSIKYTFISAVEEYRKREYGDKISSPKDFINESYASPAIKRTMLQAIENVSEIVKIMGKPPAKIFVEMARDVNAAKKRTVSRSTRLIELYKNCREQSNELFEQLKSQTDEKLRRDKLFLYFTQLGKCMYSGEVIHIDDLDAGYDIDHIYPQSKTKDDSLENRVLVKRELNKEKGDKYPIAENIREKQKSFWHHLMKSDLIGKKKYNRLVRATDFTDEEKADFIARQLVQTRQSTKLAAELLGKIFGSEKIVYVKAGNVSSFRQDNAKIRVGKTDFKEYPQFIKCRDVNDYHHAKDAYLNIVVGNVYHIKFTKNPLSFIKSSAGRNYSLNKVFDFAVSNANETAWITGDQGSVATVRKTMSKNNILFTKMARENKGGLFDQTIMPKGEGQIPIKQSGARTSISKYGGYNKASTAYFCLVEHTGKKGRIRSIETVLLVYKTQYESNNTAYWESCGLKEPKVLIPRIKIDSLFSIDGFRMHISGRTGDSVIYKNANQFHVFDNMAAYIKRISKYCERCKNAGKELAVSSFDGISEAENLKLYDYFIERISQSIYLKQFKTPMDTILDCRDSYIKLSIPDQVKTLAQILILFRCSAQNPNLNLLCGKKTVGRISLSKNLSEKNGSISIIHQSATGFYEQEIDVLSDDLTPHRVRR